MSTTARPEKIGFVFQSGSLGNPDPPQEPEQDDAAPDERTPERLDVDDLPRPPVERESAYVGRAQ